MAFGVGDGTATVAWGRGGEGRGGEQGAIMGSLILKTKVPLWEGSPALYPRVCLRLYTPEPEKYTHGRLAASLQWVIPRIGGSSG